MVTFKWSAKLGQLVTGIVQFSSHKIFFLDSTLWYNMLLYGIRNFAFVQSNMGNNE